MNFDNIQFYCFAYLRNIIHDRLWGIVQINQNENDFYSFSGARGSKVTFKKLEGVYAFDSYLGAFGHMIYTQSDLITKRIYDKKEKGYKFIFFHSRMIEQIIYKHHFEKNTIASTSDQNKLFDHQGYDMFKKQFMEAYFLLLLKK